MREQSARQAKKKSQSAKKGFGSGVEKEAASTPGNKRK
jgi:hypothetical protein